MILMTRKEMHRRLQAGESRIDVSIKKWRRIVWALRLGLDIDHHIGADTCALCDKYSVPRGCPACPYTKHFGMNCDAWDSHWRQVSRAVFGEKRVIKHAKAMLNALRELK